jgi:hypothetical protein
MPFHVEMASPPNHARAFNLDEPSLQAEVLEPWTIGLPFEFGEHEWDPRESRLTILEGSRLEPADLAFSQGWSNALRASDDVTRPMLEMAEASAPTQTAVMIEADSLEAAQERVGAGHRLQPLQWAAAVDRISGRDPELAAVILVFKPSQSGFPRS